MALEEGKQKNEGSKENPQNMAAMQKQIDELKDLLLNKKTQQQPIAAPTGGLSEDIVKRLLDELQGRKVDDAIRKNDFVSQDMIDPADLLEVPAEFYCHKGGYFLGGDIKNGVAIFPPRGPVFFEHRGTLPFDRNAKEQNLINISRYKTYSKKQKDFLLSHSLFNALFYIDIDDAINTDNVRSQKLAKTIMRLSATDAGRLVTMAKENGIKVTEDIQTLRVKLATQMVDAELEQEEKENKKRTIDAFKDRELFKEKA